MIDYELSHKPGSCVILSFGLQTTDTIPSFNFTGPDAVMIGASTVFYLDMYIPYASSRLIVDAFSSLDHPSVL